jgi:hypothetical protein
VFSKSLVAVGWAAQTAAKCAYDKNLSVGYEIVVAINDGGRGRDKICIVFQFGRKKHQVFERQFPCLQIASVTENYTS